MSALLAMDLSPEPPRIDWGRLFADMKDRGFSVYRACCAIGRDWSTVQRWRNGGEPPHLDGEKILRLHATVCGADLNERRRRGE